MAGGDPWKGLHFGSNGQSERLCEVEALQWGAQQSPPSMGHSPSSTLSAGQWGTLASTLPGPPAEAESIRKQSLCLQEVLGRGGGMLVESLVFRVLHLQSDV